MYAFYFFTLYVSVRCTFLNVVIFFTLCFSLLCTFLYFLLVGVALAGRPLPPAARTHSVFITLYFAPLHNVCLQLVLHFVLFSTLFFVGLTRILFALYVSLLCTFLYFLLLGVALAGRPLPPAARTHSVFITLCFAPLHNVCLQLVLHFVLFSTLLFSG